MIMILNRSFFNIFFGVILLVSPVLLQAQYSPDIKINYIRTWEATAPETDPLTLIARPLKDVKMTTAYTDGLGRPLQAVSRKGSLPTGGNPADLVKPVAYDMFGREATQYLPFAANNAGGNTSFSDGGFKLNPFQQQVAFGATQYPGESHYYASTEYEASPLNRVKKTLAPGSSWVGSNRGVIINYWFNTTDDAVKIWTVTDVAGGWGTYSVAGNYAAGELSKNVVADEHGKQVIEFRDKDEQVILKKVQLTATADDGSGSGYTGWLCTYYVYDDLNNLRAVIQPKAVEELAAASWTFSATQLSELCFRYEYDQRGRVIRKKVPGAGEEWLVYDIRDRVVMSQDANLRGKKQWLYRLYDGLDRPIATGLLTDNDHYNDLVWHLGQAYASTAYPNLSVYTSEELTRTFYDNYTWRSSYGNPLSATRSTVFDSYLYSADNEHWPYPQGLVQSNILTGLETGSRTKVLGSNTWLYTVNFYDDRGQVIQVQSTNSTGGTDIATMQYNWTGQPLFSVHQTQKSGTNSQTTVVLTKLTYDDLGRLQQVEKRISNSLVNNGAMPGSWTTVLQNEYDALGQLKKKTLGAGLEDITNEYNIRGWLTGINKGYLSGNGTHYFGMELAYDKTTSATATTSYGTAQYNGNITGTVWKTAGAGISRQYDFTYDAAKRLTGAAFKQNTEGNTWNNSLINFTVDNLGYDANGNIQSMRQYGWKAGSSAPIDNLSYTYYDHSNKLKNVIDASNDPGTRLGDFRSSSTYMGSLGNNKTNSATDYTYDNNGNLVKDLNKDIDALETDGIEYNLLNLPTVIHVKDKGTITYTYDASGNKLQKVVAESGKTPKTTLYLSGAVYEDDLLQFAGHEEGRIRYIPAEGAAAAHFNYDYFIRDHLGNIRIVLTDEVQTIYYPAATLEGNYSDPNANSMVNHEKRFFSIDDNYITATTSIPSWSTATGIGYGNNNGNPPVNSNYPSGVTPSQTGISERVYKLNATTNKTGLQLMLKVMSGDHVDIFGKSYYHSNQTFNNSNSTLLDIGTIMAGVLLPPGSAAGSKGITTADLTSLNDVLLPASFIRGNNGESVQVPKAYINYILLDEQFRYVAGGASRAGSSDVVKSHWQADPSLRDIEVGRNGYLYVYVSNESNVDVFFDNLQVIHRPGPLLEETHYYPFGLTMAGISSKAAGKQDNKYKAVSGNELNEDFDLNLYETLFRSYDPQLGRFHQVDPMADDYADHSPYSFACNDPVYWTDPFGADNISWQDLLKQIENGTIRPGHYYNIGDNTFDYQEIEYARYDKENQLLRIYFPQVITYDEEGHEIGVTTRKSFKQEVSEEYRPYEESAWDYVPVIGATMLALDHVKKGRWGWALFYSAMAISDACLVKSLVTSAAKAGVKAIVKASASRAARNAAKGGTTFFEGAKYSDKVLRQMGKADDLFHGFPKSVDGFATKFGQWSTKVGADGKTYQWLKMNGSYGGKTGTFEYIKDANGIINHRFFNVPKVP